MRFYIKILQASLRISKNLCTFAGGMRKNTFIFAGLIVLLVVLVALDMFTGAADVGVSALWQEGLEHRILWSLRVPRVLTAIMAGAALSLSGLSMQTLFRNPLAGPSVLGVSSGAILGVAVLVVLGHVLDFQASMAATVLFAVLGALVVLLLVLAVSARVQNNVTLLVVGVMVGSISGALVNVLQNLADPDSLKLFITWTLGSLSAVGWREMMWLGPAVLSGLMLTLVLIKPLNGLTLGEEYASSLGINVQLVRTLLILTTGLLAGSVTAFCGPIAFVGVAVPHLARGLFRTSNHQLTMPATALVGANLLLVCDVLCNLWEHALPISTVSALFGAPIVLLVVLKK